jgi:hypothetical protein
MPDGVVLEMKFLVAMPVAFKSLVAEFALNPSRFSKYRHAAATLGLATDPDKIAAKTASYVYA